MWCELRVSYGDVKRWTSCRGRWRRVKWDKVNNYKIQSLWNRLKRVGRYIVIILLFSYIMTSMINGPGVFRVSKSDAMTVKLKNGGQIPLEDYCVGILAKEIPADYEAEALKGQAVLVRTEVCRKIQETGNDGTLEEEYWTAKQMKAAWGMQYTQNYRKLKDALEETTGQVLFYGEGLAITPFFKLSNGYTRDAKEVLGKEDYPYLKSVECPADAEAENELQTGVLGENEKKIETTDIEILETDSVGYVLKVRVGEETISGEEFRNRYSLPSSCFTLQRYHDKLWVTIRGIGHGIGMSQYTANEMAKEKKSYKKILKYFFEGTEIREVTEIIKNVEEQK